MRLPVLAAAIAMALPLAWPADGRAPVSDPVAAKRADGRASFIVTFEEPPAPMFRGFQAKDGRRPALAPVSIQVTGEAQYDPARPEAEAYLDYIGGLREQRLRAASAAFGRSLNPRFVYEHALNGVALDLSPDEAERLAAMPGIRAVTPDFERVALTERGPAWIKAPEVWTGAAGVASRGEGAVVGVIDSGINAGHVSFAATAGGYTHVNPRSSFYGWCATNAGVCNTKLIGVYDFVSGGSTGTGANGADPDGHGTHVAGTAVGNPVSATIQGVPTQLSGVAPRANLIVYRGCGSTPESRTCGPNSGSQLLASINQAVADQVDVINYSIGGDPYNPWQTVGGSINSDSEAFLAAREAGIVVAAAAGNDGPEPGTHGAPANAPWVMAVAAVTHDRTGSGDRLASFSGRGPVTPLGVLKPDLAAPGVQIRAATRSGNGVAELSGTSMASPHAAGAAALVSAARPTWNADQVISALMLTARAGAIVEQSGGAATTPHDHGAGTIDLGKAVNASLGLQVAAGAFAGAGTSTASSLNLPSLASGNCVEVCTLRRTFSTMPGNAGGQYEIVASVPAGLALSATPTTFSVGAGGNQAVDFRFALNAQSTLNTWYYGSVTVRRVGGGTPDLVLPVAIYLSAGEVPSLQERTVAGDRGFVDFNLSGLVSLPDARFSSTELSVPRVREQALVEDPTNTNPYDDLSSGVFAQFIEINYSDGRSRQVRVNAFLRPASTPAARDLDLFTGVDTNVDNAPAENEERCTSTSSGAVESCSFTVTHPGNGVPIKVWALAQNWTASNTGATDTARLEFVAVDPTPSTRQVATGPGNVPVNTALSARLVYDDPTFLDGQSRYGVLFVDRGPNTPAIGVSYKLTRSGAAPSPFALSLNTDRAVTLPAGGAHDLLFVDVPAGATALTVTTQSSANVDLYLARVAPTVPRSDIPSITPAPARGSANASATTPSGNETLVVNNPAAGRWYLTPVNTSGSAADAVVRATLTGTAPSVRPGGYFNPQRGGHGFFVYPAGPVLSGLWYTYLQDGTPTWYYLEGNAPGSNGFWSGTMVRVSWNGSAPTRIPVGNATMAPIGPNEFVFTYNLDGQTGSETFQSFGGGCPNLGGSALNVSSHWFNPARSGSGYSAQMFPNYEFYAIFGYDGLGQARFLTAERPDFGGASSTLNLLQNTGFCPLCARSAEPTRTTIGTFSRTFAGGTFSNITVNGTYLNGVPGTWTANEAVQPLGSLQGCAL